MIPSHIHGRPCSNQVDDFIWIRSISHHVAEIPKPVEPAGSRQHSFKSLQITVNIG